MRTPLLLLILLFLPLAYADYPNLGGANDNYALGENRFGTTTLSTEYIASLVNPNHYPLSFDMDNDGIKEIVVNDDGIFRMYTNELQLIDGWTPSGYENFTFNFALGDMDDDGKGEIVFGGGQPDYMRVIEWNGTEFEIIAQRNDLAQHTDGECIFAEHEDDNGYWAACMDNDGGLSNSGSLFAHFLNATSYNDRLVGPFDGPDTFDFGCLPEGGVITSGDMDKDGDTEYCTNYGIFQSTAGQPEYVHMVCWEDRSDGAGGAAAGAEVLIYDLGDVEAGFTGSEDRRCESEAWNFTQIFTAHVQGDLDSIASNGLEYAFAYRSSESNLLEFRLGMFNENGAQILEQPQLLGDSEEGRLMSNTFTANVFEDTGNNDVCVMGYNRAIDNLVLLCMNPNTNEPGLAAAFQKHTTWRYDTTNLSLLDEGFKRYNKITHSTNVQNVLGARDEILTPYGTFFLLEEGCSFNVCDLLLFYDSSRRDSATIGDDLDGDGFLELIILTDSALWVQYDNVQPQPPQFSGRYQIDPCLNEPWQINTTVKVEYSAVDQDTNNLIAWVELYAGENDTVRSSNVTFQSGQDVTFNVYELVADKLTSNSALVMYVYDGEFLVNQTFYFNVGLDGNTRGDGCVTTDTFIPTPTEVPSSCVVDSDCPGAYACNGGLCLEKTPEDVVDDIIDPTVVPLGFRPFIGLLVIIAVVLGSIYVMGQNGIRDGAALTFIPVFTGSVAWIICVIFGLLAAWTILFGLVFSGAIIGWKVYNTQRA